jgi:hypothetical protein
MNERIRELAEQTGWRYDNGEWQFADDSDIEKFAELIVKECAEIAVDCDVIEYNDFRQGVAQEIKQHFGVEE